MHLKLLTEEDNLEYSNIGLNGRIIQQYVLRKILRVEVKWNEMAVNRLGEHVGKVRVLVPEFPRNSTKLENFYERFYHIIS